jgi:anti-anti-sigma regulatory factor
MNAMTASTVTPQVRADSASLPVCRIALPPRFDVHEIAEFTAMVAGVTEPACVLLVDASRVRYLDRSGIESLIQARLRCIDRGGDLVLLTSLAARITLELTGHYDALNPVDPEIHSDSPARMAA